MINTITMGPGTLTIGPPEALITFSAQVTNCRVVPSVDKGDPLNVLSGETVPGDRDESWTLAGTLVQDLGAAAGTTEWLFTHRGENHPFVFVPSTAGGKEFTGTVSVEAIEMGGDVKSKPTSDFEFDMVGAPLLDDVA